MAERCRYQGCRAPIVWATTENGRPMPVDRAPHPDGNVFLRPGPSGLTAVVLGPLERLAQGRVHQLHMPHHATCEAIDRVRADHG